MIVKIKLSIDDSKFDDIQYYVKKLQENAKPRTPGFIKYDFVGRKGTNKTKKRNTQNTTVPQIGELFG